MLEEYFLRLPRFWRPNQVFRWRTGDCTHAPTMMHMLVHVWFSWLWWSHWHPWLWCCSCWSSYICASVALLLVQWVASDVVAITTITLIWIYIWVRMVSGNVFALLLLLLMLFSSFLLIWWYYWCDWLTVCVCCLSVCLLNASGMCCDMIVWCFCSIYW